MIHFFQEELGYFERGRIFLGLRSFVHSVTQSLIHSFLRTFGSRDKSGSGEFCEEWEIQTKVVVVVVVVVRATQTTREHWNLVVRSRLNRHSHSHSHTRERALRHTRPDPGGRETWTREGEREREREIERRWKEERRRGALYFGCSREWTNGRTDGRSAAAAGKTDTETPKKCAGRRSAATSGRRGHSFGSCGGGNRNKSSFLETGSKKKKKKSKSKMKKKQKKTLEKSVSFLSLPSTTTTRVALARAPAPAAAAISMAAIKVQATTSPAYSFFHRILLLSSKDRYGIAVIPSVSSLSLSLSTRQITTITSRKLAKRRDEMNGSAHCECVEKWGGKREGWNRMMGMGWTGFVSLSLNVAVIGQNFCCSSHIFAHRDVIIETLEWKWKRHDEKMENLGNRMDTHFFLSFSNSRSIKSHFFLPLVVVVVFVIIIISRGRVRKLSINRSWNEGTNDTHKEEPRQ